MQLFIVKSTSPEITMGDSQMVSNILSVGVFFGMVMLSCVLAKGFIWFITPED